MKRFLLPVLFLLCSTNVYSQGIYGFEAGAGTVSSYGNYYTPTIEAGYLKMLFPHVLVGGAIDWRYFSFYYYDPLQQYADPNFGNILTVNHHSAYLFLSPMLDISIGENQYIHLNCSIGPGFYLYGGEATDYVSYSYAGIPQYNTINTSKNINRVIYQYSVGLSEYIPTRGYWSIKLSQQYSMLGRNLNTDWGIAPPLRTDYMSFTIGISHYYQRIFYKG